MKVSDDTAMAIGSFLSVLLVGTFLLVALFRVCQCAENVARTDAKQFEAKP